MSNSAKNNLRSVGIVFTIVLALASVVGAAFITYDNTKEAKKDIALLQTKTQSLETKQARFEGIIDERTRNTQKRVDDIYDIVKDWEAVPSGK